MQESERERTRRIYADIIDLPPHVSSKHPRMSLYDRAAIFAPFAALTGFEDMIEEESERINSAQAYGETYEAEPSEHGKDAQ